MEIDCIIVELISLFTELDLINLVFVNKKLNLCILEIFVRKLNFRYKDCILMGDTIDLNTFCYRYMCMLSGTNKYKEYIYLSSYNYCDDCEMFGLLKDNTICKFGCTLICCGEKNISIISNKKLACGCYTTSRTINTRCKCGNKITSSITKCSNCNKIPLRVITFNDKRLKYKNGKYYTLH